MRGISIEERAVNLAHYIIDSKDTVRGAAKKFGISKSTVHTDVTLKNGKINRRRKLCFRNGDYMAVPNGQVIPESIEIKRVFLSKRNPIVKLELVIK